MIRRLSPVLMLVFLGCLVTGCTPWVTYPAPEDAFSLSHPTIEPVPGLMTAAIRWAHATHGDDRDFAFNLPAGTPKSVYATVINRLGAGKPQDSADEWTYHVLKVMSRGRNGQVDMLYPTGSGRYEFVTVHFYLDLATWDMMTTRLWRIPQDVPPPNYDRDPDGDAGDGEADGDDADADSGGFAGP